MAWRVPLLFWLFLGIDRSKQSAWSDALSSSCLQLVIFRDSLLDTLPSRSQEDITRSKVFLLPLSAACGDTTIVAGRDYSAPRNLFIPRKWSGHGAGGWCFSKLDDAAADNYRHRLRAITGAQLFHDVFDVNLDGLLRNEEAFGDVPIPVPAGDVSEDVYFTWSQ